MTVAIQTQRVEKCSGLKEVLLARLHAAHIHAEPPANLMGSEMVGFLKASKAFWGNRRPWQGSSTICLQVTKPEYWVTLLNVVLKVPDMMQMLQLSHLVLTMTSLCQSTLLVGETEASLLDNVNAIRKQISNESRWSRLALNL